MTIIGIDPGTATTGYGIIETKEKIDNFNIGQKKRGKDNQQSVIKKVGQRKTEARMIAYGVIKTTPGLNPEKRLKTLYTKLSSLLNKFKPDILVVEKVYFAKNIKTVIPVSEAKGVILLAASKKNIKVLQVTPLQIKMSICGYGRADKSQVQKMVKEFLGLEKVPKPDDAADALAAAICYPLSFTRFN
ncbi:crossover junction endodeoxyribonuclease RuvC [bacterium]|nr:crossover junction endodeoxyribonuclease RuvC [bacterium]